MPSFSDSIFLFVLALLLFGPKKLPVLARELGKWVGEFRRASNEFKMQMEDELRQVEQAERLKKIEAMEAAAPVAPALPGETVHSQTSQSETSHSEALPEGSAGESAAVTAAVESVTEQQALEADAGFASEEPAAEPVVKPIAIAGSGEVTIMPPATGLPTPRNSSLSGLLKAIPKTEANGNHGIEGVETETRAHGD